MRIAIIGFGFSGSIIPLARRLGQLGHKVDLYFLVDAGEKSLEGIDFYSTSYFPRIKHLSSKEHSSTLYFSGLSIRLSLMIRIKRRLKLEYLGLRIIPILNRILVYFYCMWLKNAGYDVINIVGHTDLIRDFSKHLSDCCKVVHTIHEVLSDHSSYNSQVNPSIKFLGETLNKIVVPSNKSKIDLLSSLRLSPERIVVIPFGVFESFLFVSSGNQGLNLPERYLLFLGHIHNYKGLGILRESVRVLKERIGHSFNIKIIVAGKGNDPELPFIMEDSSFVVYNRYIDNSELVYLIKNCEAVVCPYLSASQSGLPQVAHLFNKPVIATKVGAFREVVINLENGILVERIDGASFADGIQAFLELNRKGFKWDFSSFRKMYDWDSITKRYLDEVFI